MRKPIVIIGGMGPQASIRLHELLIQKSTKHHHGNNDGYPAIAHFSIPVPDFLASDLQKRQAIAMLCSYEKTIQALQPQIILLACNTAHLVTQEVSYLHSEAFLHMIDVVAGAVKQDGIERVGLLASPTTIRSGLYSHALRKQHLATIAPDAKGQKVVESAIRSVLAGRATKAKADTLSVQAQTLVKQGAQAIVLGCTELPLLFRATEVNVPVYDCLDLYADAAINHYYLYNGA